jgi:hypothetical protein
MEITPHGRLGLAEGQPFSLKVPSRSHVTAIERRSDAFQRDRDV